MLTVVITYLILIFDPEEMSWGYNYHSKITSYLNDFFIYYS